MFKFNLTQFERDCLDKQGQAYKDLIALLDHMNTHSGDLPHMEFFNLPPRLNVEKRVNYLLNRIITSVSFLFTSTDSQIEPYLVVQLFTHQRWLALIFGVSVLKNADHLINLFLIKNTPQQIEFKKNKIILILLLYFPDSQFNIPIDQIWLINKEITLCWCFAILSNRHLITEEACTKREKILEFLAKISMEDIKINVKLIPEGILHDVYMHCSYAFTPLKHEVKKLINKIIQTYLQYNNISGTTPVPLKKPHKILVVVEWFTSAHSIYRTHSKSLEGLKDHFEVIGAGFSNKIDKVTIQSFNKFISIPKLSLAKQVQFIKEIIKQEQISILYMPSIGMSPLTIWLSNTRSCIYQIIALGHPATTFSEYIDYVVVEEDFIGNPNLFSEKILQLKSNGMPYRYPSHTNDYLSNTNSFKKSSEVAIAVCSTSMKLNYVFLSTLNKISRHSKKKIHFNFLIGNARNLTHNYIESSIKSIIESDCTVYSSRLYDNYLQCLNDNNIFLNPFPFGNTNGIIDCVIVNKIGICKTGDEVHEHIDEGLFTRLGYPKWTVCKTIDEYIKSAIKLIDIYSDFDTNYHEEVKTKLKDKVINGDVKNLAYLFMSLINSKNDSNK
ncbi:hypothetical protein FERRO_18320 [Ferrovum sp. JA12]|uniref:hypothetical protein n=1 Tax=Ferrovum sp. JA12 TaxID=1356299 RepID=UPI0007024A97|nr:hypothetical protein [Ferrovum sp. JA12]KRH78834.1 hypothetical protein FERRO_18320 [Ferrovum sp. JA12]